MTINMRHELRDICRIQSSKSKGKRPSRDSFVSDTESDCSSIPTFHAFQATLPKSSNTKATSDYLCLHHAPQTQSTTPKTRPRKPTYVRETSEYIPCGHRPYYFLEREVYVSMDQLGCRRLPRLISVHPNHADGEWHMHEYLSSLKGRACEKWLLQEQKNETTWSVRWVKKALSEQNRDENESYQDKVDGFDVRLTKASAASEEEAWATRITRWKRFDRHESMASMDECSSQGDGSESSIILSLSSEDSAQRGHKQDRGSNKKRRAVYRLFPPVTKKPRSPESPPLSNPSLSNASNANSSVRLETSAVTDSKNICKSVNNRKSFRQFAVEHFRGVLLVF